MPIKCTGEKTKQLSKESGNRFTTTFKDFSDTARITNYQASNPIMDLNSSFTPPIDEFLRTQENGWTIPMTKPSSLDHGKLSCSDLKSRDTAWRQTDAFKHCPYIGNEDQTLRTRMKHRELTSSPNGNSMMNTSCDEHSFRVATK